MVSKFTVIPLAVMFLLSMASLSGLGIQGAALGSGDINPYQAKGLATDTIYTVTNDTLYYDICGHPVVYANLLPYGENGTIVDGQYSGLAMWTNHTGIGINTPYPLYYDTNAQDPVIYQDAIIALVGGGQAPHGQAGLQVNFSTSMGLVAVIVGLMAVALLAGFHFFGSGESDVSIGMILKSVGFLSIWGILSALSLSLLGQIPLAIGYILYFAFTAMYSISLIDDIGHPSGE